MKLSFILKSKLNELRTNFSKYNFPNHLDNLIQKDANIGKMNRAAVLIPISIDKQGSTYFTYTRRSQKMKLFKGECVFVGGDCEPNDKNFVETSQREAKEEAGIDKSRLEIICEFKPIMTTYRSMVTPIVSIFDDQNYDPKLNTDEVDLIFKVPTSHFMIKKHHRAVLSEYKGRKFYVHYFDWLHNVERVVIPGTTAMITALLSAVVHSKIPDYDIDPNFKWNNHNLVDFLDYVNLDLASVMIKDMTKEKYKPTLGNAVKDKLINFIVNFFSLKQ